MVFTPIISGDKWKPVPDPDGIMVLYEYDTSGKNVTNTLTGLTKENLKKGCLLYIQDNNSACVLYVHEEVRLSCIQPTRQNTV